MEKNAKMQEEIEEELAMLRLAFDHFDKNRDGTITLNEFGDVCQALGRNPTKEDIKDMISDVDKDKNGKLTFDEFVSLIKKHQRNQTKADREAELKDAFRIFDKNKNGFICAKELRKVIQGCGETLTDEEVDEMMAIADINKDDNIDYNEFVKLFA